MFGRAVKGIRQTATGGTLSAPPRGRGSFEGYMHASATHLQVNGSGYSNPAMQKARQSRPAINLKISRSNPVGIMGKGGTSILDTRMNGRVGSSVDRLKRQMRLDKMF